MLVHGISVYGFSSLSAPRNNLTVGFYAFSRCLFETVLTGWLLSFIGLSFEFLPTVKTVNSVFRVLLPAIWAVDGLLSC